MTNAHTVQPFSPAHGQPIHACVARCRMRPESGRYKLCATIALSTHFRDPRSKKTDEDARSFSRGVADAGTCAGNSDGEDRKRHRRTDWSLPCKISGAEGPQANASKSTVPVRRHAPCCWASFREIASASRRAPLWSSTVHGIWRVIRRLLRTATVSYGRLILKACAGGSNRMAGCILKPSR